MSPLDRIEQLNKEGNALRDEIALLRSQLADGHEQAKRDSATIAKQCRTIEDLEEALFECNF